MESIGCAIGQFSQTMASLSVRTSQKLASMADVK